MESQVLASDVSSGGWMNRIERERERKKKWKNVEATNE